MAFRSSRRVVVSGLGAVTPLGVGVRETWSRLLAGHGAVRSFDCSVQRHASLIQYAPRSVQIAAMLPESLQSETDLIHNIKPELKAYASSPFIAYAMAAAQEALKDAQLIDETLKIKNAIEPTRMGVAIGSGIGSIQECYEAGAAVYQQHNNVGRKPRISAYAIPRLLINLAAGCVSIMYNMQGPNHATATACTTGAHSIGDAFRIIRDGDAEIMLCGGTEASINPIAISLFAKCRALSTKYNERPDQASRPFDTGRDGFVMGEGCGLVVLEELEHALSRKAPIYAEIVGYGMSGDAFHITAPAPDGRGARQCMLSALRSAGLKPEDIGYINAHATSTPLGDAIEVSAIKSVFAEHSRFLLVSSTKGAVGHMLGAAGSVEAIFTILSLQQQIVPPTINLDQPDLASGCDLDFVPNASRSVNMNAAMTNSFGFGGTNASLIFAKFL